MKVLKAYINWRENTGSSPELNMLVDEIPRDLTYEKKGNIYFAEKDGYVKFFAWSEEGNDGGMYGSKVPITMKDGKKVSLTGPWSSNGEAVEKAGFGPSMGVAITDDTDIFERSGGYYAANITLELAREIVADLDGVGIERDPFGEYVPVRKEKDDR